MSSQYRPKFQKFFTKRVSVLWTLLAGGYLLKTLNRFGEIRKIHNLIDDITLTVLFGSIAFYSWKQYYKLKKEKIKDEVNKIKEENNV